MTAPTRSPKSRDDAHAPAATPLDIQPLTPERLGDLASLFGQGGDPKWCWCSYYRVRGRDFSSASENRETLEQAVRTLAGERRAPGLIAYRDGEPIGWVSLGPREDYQRIEHSVVLKRVDDRPVWSIVCFVVSRRARGQGVAHALLEAAIDYARDHGAKLLEAYPVDTGGERISSATAFKGTLSMFERAGFEVVARRQFNRTSPVRPIVRRRIRARRTVNPGRSGCAC
jgi:GNAT superfamily N-acetyltransferase